MNNGVTENIDIMGLCRWETWWDSAGYIHTTWVHDWTQEQVTVFQTGDWTFHGPVSIATCNNGPGAALTVPTHTLSGLSLSILAVGAGGSWNTSTTTVQAPAFSCEDECGEGTRSYQMKSRQLVLKYTKSVTGEGCQEPDQVRYLKTTGTTQVMIASTQCE